MKQRFSVAHWGFAFSVLMFGLCMFLFVPVTTHYATTVLLIIKAQPPEVSYVVMNRSGLFSDPDISPLLVTGGTTTSYKAVAQLKDPNGYSDIVAMEMVLYRAGVTGGSFCLSNPENCYRSSMREGTCASVSTSAQAGVLTCTFDLAYWADATIGERTSYGDDFWQLAIQLHDTAGETYINEQYTNEVDSLLQLRFPEFINYGALERGASSPEGSKISVENIGNVDADVQVRISDLICTVGTIPVQAQRMDVEQGSFAEMTARDTSLELSLEPTRYTRIVLPARTTDQPSTDDLYWSIQVPESGVSGTCEGGGILTGI